ncbi:MAG: spore cortex biosynthesis protein YabQ [Firmicutes bacterium]|nr:spore cortex biosynthesis protein YabQ [Bacillota bacterium]
MTELIRSQLLIIMAMTGCGLAGGLVQAVFRSFVMARSLPAWAAVFMELAGWAVVGFMISEFLYFCDNGKITFVGIISFAAGLLLWKKMFCDILTLTGGEDGKEKRTDKPVQGNKY